MVGCVQARPSHKTARNSHHARQRRCSDDEGPSLSPETTSFNLGWIWTISLVAALGGLLFGYDWVVIGGAKPFYEKYLSPDDAVPGRAGR